MAAILEVLFGLATTNWKGLNLGVKRAGFDRPVYVLCTIVWLCIVFVVSII